MQQSPNRPRLLHGLGLRGDAPGRPRAGPSCQLQPLRVSADAAKVVASATIRRRPERVVVRPTRVVSTVAPPVAARAGPMAPGTPSPGGTSPPESLRRSRKHAMNRQPSHTRRFTSDAGSAECGRWACSPCAGVLALVGHAAGAITDETVDAGRGGVASDAPPGRPDETGTWTNATGSANQAQLLWGSTGFRSSIAHSHQPLVGAAGAARPLRPGVQRGDLRLPEVRRDRYATSRGAGFATDGDGEAIVAAFTTGAPRR